MCKYSIDINHLLKWIEKLEIQLSQQLAKAKRNKFNLFNDNTNQDNFTNIALELEKYMNMQIKGLPEFIQIQFNNEELDNKIFNEVININSEIFHPYSIHVLIDKLYEDKLIIKNLTNIYKFYYQKIYLIYNEIVNKIKQKYNIYNLKN